MKHYWKCLIEIYENKKVTIIITANNSDRGIKKAHIKIDKKYPDHTCFNVLYIKEV